MKLQKTIIGVAIAAVSICGILLGIDSFKSTKKDVILKTTTANFNSSAIPVVELNLVEPPKSLKMLTVEKTSENPDQETSNSNTVQEESTPQETSKSTEFGNYLPAQRRHRVHKQREYPSNNNDPQVEVRNKTYETSPSISDTTPSTAAQEYSPNSLQQSEAASTTESTNDEKVWFLSS